MSCPFQSSRKRLVIYYFVSIVTTLIVALIGLFTKNVFSYLSMLLMLTYFILAASCTVYCLQRLPNSGLSQQIRSLIWRRHLFWTMFFTVSNMYPLYATICSALNKINDEKIVTYNTTFEKVVYWIYITQGVWVFAHMVIEPNFYLQIWEHATGRTSEKHKLCPMMLCVS